LKLDRYKLMKKNWNSTKSRNSE